MLWRKKVFHGKFYILPRAEKLLRWVVIHHFPKVSWIGTFLVVCYDLREPIPSNSVCKKIIYGFVDREWRRGWDEKKTRKRMKEVPRHTRKTARFRQNNAFFQSHVNQIPSCEPKNFLNLPVDFSRAARNFIVFFMAKRYTLYACN